MKNIHTLRKKTNWISYLILTLVLISFFNFQIFIVLGTLLLPLSIYVLFIQFQINKTRKISNQSINEWDNVKVFVYIGSTLIGIFFWLLILIRL
jgi:hypothetical protein